MKPDKRVWEISKTTVEGRDYTYIIGPDINNSFDTIKVVPATELQRVQAELDQAMKDWSFDAIKKTERIVKLEKLLDEAVKREIHLENCVEQLYDIIALSDFVTKREHDTAVKIYNDAEIVVRDNSKLQSESE